MLEVEKKYYQWERRKLNFPHDKKGLTKEEMELIKAFMKVKRKHIERLLK